MSKIKDNLRKIVRLSLLVCDGLMLGQGCLRALFGKQFPPPLNWVENGFLSMSRSGSKVGKKVGFDPFSPTFAPKNPLLNPLQAIDEDPS